MPFEVDDKPAAIPADNSVEAAAETGKAFTFEGHVDFYGYHATARGWLFGGWIVHPWPPGNRPEDIVAHFAPAAPEGGIAEGEIADGATVTVAGHTVPTFYFRADVQSRGIGYVFFLRGPAPAPSAPQAGALRDLEIQFTLANYAVRPTREVLSLNSDALLREVEAILAAGEEGSQRRKLLELMRHGTPMEAVPGFIDFYGYHAAAGGWLLSGWVTAGWPAEQRPEHVMVSFEDGDVHGAAVAALFPRPDLSETGAVASGEGVAFFVPASAAALGSFSSLSFEIAGVRSTLYPGTPLQRVNEAELISRCEPLLASGAPESNCAVVRAILARRPYAGQDTLSTLSDTVMFETDEAIFCAPDGLMLLGWYLAKPGVVRAMRLRCGTLVSELDLARAIVVNRPDVVAVFAAQHGFDDPLCGFIAFVPHAAAAGLPIYIEIETGKGEIGYRGVPRPKLQGMAAIRHILERVNVRFAAVPDAYARTVGPAVELLNRSRLARRPAVEVIQYGTRPANPRHSVIVPLYGRVDFIEYQMALFSERPAAGNGAAGEVEYIYVLDDPPRQQETQFLCASVHARFGIPMTLLLLSHNVGFAPANNIGLAHATGDYVAFLNSDVFPGTPDWLEQLTARLAADPALGVVAALLLYEDGAVQHQGMEFRKLREFGNWYFGHHEAKGLRYAGGSALRHCISITGACMVLPRPLAEQLGGFDEVYVIGDFEDSDLCLRLQALGYRCAVDPTVQLYHLERQSQASAAATWRLNLTVYNAWQHQRRWADAIAAHDAHAVSEPVASGG